MIPGLDKPRFPFGSVEAIPTALLTYCVRPAMQCPGRFQGEILGTFGKTTRDIRFQIRTLPKNRLASRNTARGQITGYGIDKIMPLVYKGICTPPTASAEGAEPRVSRGSCFLGTSP